MATKNTLVIGASTNPERYSFLAVNKLVAHQHPVSALGNAPGRIGTIEIESTPRFIDELDTISLYLNPQKQPAYYDYILSLSPKRIIFNPGAENPELASLAQSKGIIAQEACTLVLLSTGQY